jgi:tRNA threonylcarbamoyladenosine biosynthesis protein TsaB
MYILHIETSTVICSVAISRDLEILAHRDIAEGMNHTAMLTPAIEEMLKTASIAPRDLSAVAVGSGPGSYTGLRVGSSTAKAMAYSMGIPVIAVPTLMALAKAAFDRYPDAEFALPMLDARRREVYTALYDRSLQEVIPVSSVILNEDFFESALPDTDFIISCGDGSLKIGELESLAGNLKVDTTILCSAAHMVSIAVDSYHKGQHQDPLHFVSYYLKPPNITEAKKGGLATS